MLCPNCGHFSTTDTIVCGMCGKMLPRAQSTDQGVRAIRQGKRAREAALKDPEHVVDPHTEAAERTYVDPGADRIWGTEPIYTAPEIFDADGRPLSGSDLYRRPSVMNDESHDPVAAPRKNPRRGKQKRMINWAIVLIAGIAGAMALVIGVAFFLLRTGTGQKQMARWGFEVSSSVTLWEVGDECMDIGDISEAIEYYEKAYAMDEEADSISVPYLLELGGAYEAADRLEEAEALYVRIYTEIAPSAPDAYTNVIRIMLADPEKKRDAEAAVLMQLAYSKTGSSTFSTQRTNLLPSPPNVNLTAGYYEEVKTLTLTSPEGYAIYYTFDEKAVLPFEGSVYKGPITLKENSWPLRAVCVNGDLVSDELSANYTVSMPSPGTPYPSLAANTYTQRQRVRLFQNIERTRDPNITIYYTIDGSAPDKDSPIFDQDGEKGILLPGGRVTLKAVSVNEYGKASNTLEVGYKIEAKPYPLTAYNTDDTANGLRLNATTFETFTQTYGQPLKVEEITRAQFDGKVTRCSYAWGYAVFHNLKGNNTLIELYFTNGTFKGPRSTGIGTSLDGVVSKFRDMGQVWGNTGNRGLYFESDGVGRIYRNGNGTTRDGESEIIYADRPEDVHIIRYWCSTAEGHVWSLDYICDASDTVVAIDLLYLP